MLLRAKSAITPQGEVADLVLRINDGIITELFSDASINVDQEINGTLIPGFVDIHCHGGGGYYFSDSNNEHIAEAISLHNQKGTTSLIASLVTAPIDTLHKEISRLLPFYHAGTIAGIHLEGPYLSAARCGAHDPDLLRRPEISEIQGLLELGGGAIKVVTIAPELPGALDVIAFLKSSSVIAAIGHTNATADEIQLGVKAGANLITHFHNAMEKLHSSQLTAAEYILNDTDLPLELILDGVHVPSEVSNMLLDSYLDRTILITDAMSAAGCSDGNYSIGTLDVIVENSVARLKSNGALAGSTLTMEQTFFGALGAGLTLVDAVKITSTNPAKALSLVDVGELRVGAKADILTINMENETVERVEVFE